ncbi:MAG: trypsin-like peptidase domain-containing protein [Candidatus Babeliales bacterium]
MKLWHIVGIITVTFMSFGAVLFVVKLQRDQQELRQLLKSSTIDVQQSPRTEIVERIVSPSATWSDLQAKVKDTVAQIFSQVAAVDLLQPYRTPHQYQTTGSGFFINKDGEIITNAHVIDQAKSVWIQIPSLGKHQIDVDVVGVSPERDLALLKIRPEGLDKIKSILGDVPYLNLGDSDFIHRADEIMTLGYPLGQQGLKSTVGVVSGRESHLIQIDAPINPGNSGGPSIDRRGSVVGINTMYAPDAQNIGYVIPINELKVILDDLRTVRLLRKPFLGILFNNASESLTNYLGNPGPGGLYVVNVYKGSPLSRAGIKRGDMIYEINGHKIDIYGELAWNEDKISIIDYVSQLKLGQEVHLVIYRNGKRQDISLLFDQSELLPIRKIYPGFEAIDYEIVAGMVIQPLTINHLPALINMAPSLAKYTEMKHQMESALIITHIFPDSQAHRSRALMPGAVLKKVNDERVKTMDDMRQALFKGLTSENLTIETTDGVFVVCPFKKVLHDDIRLAKDYFFPLSPTMQTLVAKAGITNEPAHNMMLADNQVPMVPINSDVAMPA